MEHKDVERFLIRMFGMIDLAELYESHRLEKINWIELAKLYNQLQKLTQRFPNITCGKSMHECAVILANKAIKNRKSFWTNHPCRSNPRHNKQEKVK